MKQKTKTLTANDKRSIVKNPTSEEYVLDIANRIKLGHITPSEVVFVEKEIAENPAKSKQITKNK